MRNVYINQAETIFEPFWDCGDSYPGHKKYSCLSKYKIDRDKSARVENMWCGVSIKLAGSDDGEEKRVILSRDCNLDIEGFDILRFFGNIQKEIRFIINCVIDGEKRTVIDRFGLDDTGEIDGAVSGKNITFLEIVFEYSGISGANAVIHWLGLSNSEKQTEMENVPSPYTSEWEGCFSDKPEIRPEYGIYFDSEGLKAIREKIKKEPYREKMDLLRERAKEDMQIEPEKIIGKLVGNMDRRWRRDRDMRVPDIVHPMGRLAFVGIVDEDPELLRMACRMALSVCHCEYWCESIMGIFPGATWHHRSFTEEILCVECVKVLEWAGGLLSWHGKNIIYDSIIMKGLPRILADLKTMDYIWSMNQGVVFTSSLVVTLLMLKSRYPRYEVDLEYAEKSLYEMWENFCDPDGGVPEGPAYWNYTISNLVIPTWLLARNAGVSLRDYAKNSLKKSADYALCLLSDAGDRKTMIPINDTHSDKGFSPLVSAFYYEVTGDPRWKAVFNRKFIAGVDGLTELIIFGSEIEKAEEVELKEEYINLTFSGHMSLRRNDSNVGFTRIFIQNSPIIFSHTHQDKGSFVLEAGGKALLIDRGMCNYSEPYGLIIQLPEQHNLLVPVREGFPYRQHTSSSVYSGKTIESEYDGKVMKYSIDLSETWEEDVFKKYVRSFYSDSADTFIITDDVVCKERTVLKFCLNSYGRVSEENGEYIIDCDGIKMKVTPVNWTPEKVFAGEMGRDSENLAVNQLGLYTGAYEECVLKTKIQIVKEQSGFAATAP